MTPEKIRENPHETFPVLWRSRTNNEDDGIHNMWLIFSFFLFLFFLSFDAIFRPIESP